MKKHKLRSYLISNIAVTIDPVDIPPFYIELIAISILVGLVTTAVYIFHLIFK